MKPLSAAAGFHLLYLGLLRCASLWVPAWQRAEWWKEWRAELWHVHQSYSSSSAPWWRREREVAAFCLGALHDAHSLRCHCGSTRVPLATTMGSAPQCLLFLMAILSVSFVVALFLPGVRAALQPSRYRDVRHLMLIRSASSIEDTVPSISAQQFQRWAKRRQQLFDGFAFYRMRREPVAGIARGTATLEIARSSSNLFDLLGLPIRFAVSGHQAGSDLPRLILSDAEWKRDFAASQAIFGHVVKVGVGTAVIAGVAPSQPWRLPGAVDAWLLLPSKEIAPGEIGFVVAHLKPSAEHAGWGERWHLSTPGQDGATDELLCVSLAERMQTPWSSFLLSVFLACVALPATTSLPLGEYRVHSHRVSWRTRLRRWGFLLGKLALLLPIAYLLSVDMAYLHRSLDPISSQSIQIVCSFLICLLGLRWVLRDQRQRCPVCLGKLSHPARVGHPSRNFLAWHGTELICIGGHGLLHIPEMPTSWFSTQRWLYLDPSWDVLFAEQIS